MAPKRRSPRKTVEKAVGRIGSFVHNVRAFALRGNVVDTAIGIILGSAFNKIVSSLVEDICMPLLGMLMGGVNLSHYALTLRAAKYDEAGKLVSKAVTIGIGSFLQEAIDFCIIALSLYVMVQAIMRMHHVFEREKASQDQQAKKEESEKDLLREIRDELRKGASDDQHRTR